jgi:hypothetical protein
MTILIVTIMSATVALGETMIWESFQNGSEDMEFGITALDGGLSVQSPSVFESGYNGAYTIEEFYFGWGQSFAVASERTLTSVQLRIGDFEMNNPTGQFQVAVYEFDEFNNTAYNKIAYVFANAEDYSGFDKFNVPVSSFDMSGFNAVLDPSKAYALAVTQMPSFTGGVLTIQGAQNIYPGGSSYMLTISESAQPPIADAGPNQIAFAWMDGIADVNLDGSASYGPDGNELTYLWQWSIDGNDYEANGVNPTIELPVGQHMIELVVNDGFEDSEPDYVEIIVVEPIEGMLRIAPQMINRRCAQKRIMTTLWLPEGITRDQIDSNSILLLYPGEVEAHRQFVTGVRRVCIFGFFDRDEILEAIGGAGSIEVYVVGQLNTGQYFYGSDTMRIIGPGRRPPRWNMRDWFHNRRWHYPFAQSKPD